MTTQRVVPASTCNGQAITPGSIPGGMWSWSQGDFRVDGIEPCPECGESRYSDPDMRHDTDPWAFRART
jgi:hypothetical protein